jgi:TRAP-type C4-dicarboxylate transport system permease small subunit
MKKKVLWIFNHIEEIITFVFFIVMSLLVTLQVFLRYIFGFSIPFAEELARFSYVWVSFIGISISTKYRESIQIDFFVEQLPPLPQKIIRIIIDIGTLLLLILLVILGLNYAWRNRIMSSPALQISMFLVYISFPLGFFMAAIRIIGLIIKNLHLLFLYNKNKINVKHQSEAAK